MLKRTLLFSVLFFSLVLTSHAQSETLLDGDIDHGGFGGVKTQVSQVFGETAVMVGVYGAWLIDHSFALGLSGQSLSNDIHYDKAGESNQKLQFDYGGFYLGYIHKPDKLVHFTVEATVGNGTINVEQTDSDNQSIFDDDNVFVFDPHLNLELNLTHFMRFTIGAGYRFVSGVNLENLENNDFKSFTLNTTVRFGSF